MDSLPPDLRDELDRLRARFVGALGGRLHEVEEALGRLESGDAAGFEPFRMTCHRLAGSAATYGLDEVSAAARSLSGAVDRHPGMRGEGLGQTTARDGLRRLAAAVARAGGDRGGSRIAESRGEE